MERITDVYVEECTKSRYIKPLRLRYKQNREDKIWDLIKEHDDIAILLYNKSNDSFVFVKQFRPAIYLNNCETEQKNDKVTIDSDKYPGSLGITYELCAGLIDKDVSPAEIAKMEILEECGFDVPLDSIEHVTSYRSGVGTTGSKQYFFYAEVTEEMRTGKGGGVEEEGEMIDVIEIPKSEVMTFVMDESINKPVGMVFAVFWYFQNKSNACK
ncbi:uridine diphosphate glucose pyrophosphatase NUDT14-like isoform X2 [Saccostrea cucullata]|uniref:uridine diphosphate glucose pyrophosphatase NUDT14-like isoform X2 n=1 Tax=Saccostrea cuccullata TaxID=36930 RepID=UPI002ED6A416